MFGFGNRDKKRQMVTEEVERARGALASTDVAAVQRARDTLFQVWSEAGSEGDDAWKVLRELEQLVIRLTRGALERRAVPCTRCTGREFAVSEPFRFRELDVPGRWETSPVMRFWVCRACGGADIFVDDLAEVKGRFFPEVVRVPTQERGPFR